MDEDDVWNKLQENYPAVASHLIQFKVKAKKRSDKGKFWWELRPCDYYYEMDKKK